MALPAVTASAKSLIGKLFSRPLLPNISPIRFFTSTIKATDSSLRSKSRKKDKENQKHRQKTDSLVKRRTRSDRELDIGDFSNEYGNNNSAHVPVMLAEVLDVFALVPLKSFVDCTIGAGGHSAAIIQAHPEMKLYVGCDVDPAALEMAEVRISGVLNTYSNNIASDLKVHTVLKNFRYIKSMLHDIDEKVVATGVHGILMDLGMSSMQVNNAARGFSVMNNGPLDMRMNPQDSLKAEDILNSWPEVEVGRILRDYGEESNWYSLQNKVVKARLTGGLHSTHELVHLIRGSNSWTRGGRQGWIKTATRVFQALRIAVNDELDTLKDSIHSSFDSLASGGRLAVISFHSLEDRIVKQVFLDIINRNGDIGSSDIGSCDIENEMWVKQILRGKNATILTKRPITPSESEEKFNPRSRSAKLRVIQKL